MTKARKTKAKIKTKARNNAKAGWKAPNKRKRIVTAAAKPEVAPIAAPTIAKEPKPQQSFPFWPLEVMKWWMPSSART
jgi:hypothetical protein